MYTMNKQKKNNLFTNRYCLPMYAMQKHEVIELFN